MKIISIKRYETGQKDLMVEIPMAFCVGHDINMEIPAVQLEIRDAVRLQAESRLRPPVAKGIRHTKLQITSIRKI